MSASSEKKSENKKPSDHAAAELKKGLEDVLSEAQGDTRERIAEAIKKQEDTGEGFMDILKTDLDRETFSRIWAYLHKPIGGTGNRGKKSVKDLLLAGGWIDEDEWEDLEQSREIEEGRLLVQSGYITEQQLQDALAQQEKSGQSFWRILVNRGLIAPKQIADVRKYGARQMRASLDEEAVKRVLMRTGLVSEDEIDKAIEERKRTGRDIFQTLINSHAISRDVLGEALAKELEICYVDLADETIDKKAVNLLPEHLARQNRMIPISLADNTVRLAMSNPQDVAAREQFRMMVNMDVEPVLAFESDVLNAIDKHYDDAKSAEPKKALSGIERLKARLRGAAAADESVVNLAENVGVINLVGSIVEGAINSHATDIHLEPQANELRVRYRIDGMLYDVMNLPENLQAGVLSRVKVLAGMDITERRKPQDGHFAIDVLDQTYDLRVASIPTVLGEKVVLRLLNPEDVFRGLRELGLEEGQLERMEHAIAKPYGMILVTGPIGSGKTTTLYAALSQVDILTQNVITIEEPVEYQLPGINQIQVDRRIDRTFAEMLRSVLRQDADVMMVGEIRDTDTARVAVRAAMTGHLVFSTLHTNDAIGAVETLDHMGVLPFFTASALVAVCAQRLVRVLCPECKEQYKPVKAEYGQLGFSPQKAGKIDFYRPAGCSHCFDTGYKGRTGLFEIFENSEQIRKAIVSGKSHDDMKATAIDEGMTTLMECGIEKLQAGVTSIDEIVRVTTTA